MWIWLFAIVVILALAYVRLAPSDPKRWHVDIAGEADKNMAGGAIRIIEGEFAKLNAIIQGSGAHLLAGSVDVGHATYISRSRVIGFPDYTTVQVKGDKIAIYGRLRFGRSDFAVNRSRIEQWIAQL